MITFPTSPAAGQEFLADNGVTYVWTGDYWSNAIAIATGKALYTQVGGNAATTFDGLLDNELDGGAAFNAGS